MEKRNSTGWFYALGLIIIGIGLLALVQFKSPLASTASTTNQSLSSDFQQAATKYKVPTAVLLAVAENESGLSSHQDKPSVDGGYGIMHLTQAPKSLTKGSTSQKVSASVLESLNTISKASSLTGFSENTLKTNNKANIFGGAALLAYYQKESKHKLSNNVNDWKTAIQKYNFGSTQADSNFFSSIVYKTLKTGFKQNGITLQPEKVDAVNEQPTTASQANVDGPAGLNIESVPALYKEFDNQGDYGNYDLANRPSDGLQVRYIVIHNTEENFANTLKTFSTPSYTSANYVVRSSDGQIAEMVQPQNVAWHAGNWYINSHSVGIEHEGFAAVGGYWYSPAMYKSSAALVKYLANRFNIPLDRQHIIGHDNVPGITTASQKGMHWDPGTYWNWNYYFKLLGINLSKANSTSPDIITITPNSKYNLTKASGQKVTDNKVTLPLKDSNFVYLYKKPSFKSELIADKNFSSGTSGTTEMDDWADKAVYGQQFHEITTKGDWTEIDYGGQQAWFYNPGGKNSTDSLGQLVTPNSSTPVPVYGTAYPTSDILKAADVTTTTPQVLYYMQPGEKYVFGGQMQSDFFNSNFNSNSPANVIKGNDQYVQVQFNHRIGFVPAADVTVSNAE